MEISKVDIEYVENTLKVNSGFKLTDIPLILNHEKFHDIIINPV